MAHAHDPRRTSIRDDLARRIDALPVAPTAAAAPAQLWVQTLVIEGLLLGTYEGVHDFTDDEWEGLLEALSRYGGPATPRSGRPSAPVALDMDLFRDPDRPLLDAVLAIVLAEGHDALTLERVAEVSERSVSFLLSAFGSVDELFHDVLEQAYADGFDDLSTLRDEISARTVTDYLAVFDSTRQIASLWRVFVLTGVAAPAEVRTRVEEGHRAARAVLPSPCEDPAAWLVPLALDGWAFGSTTAGYAWMDDVPAAVPAELARLLHETTGTS